MEKDKTKYRLLAEKYPKEIYVFPRENFESQLAEFLKKIEKELIIK